MTKKACTDQGSRQSILQSARKRAKMDSSSVGISLVPEWDLARRAAFLLAVVVVSMLIGLIGSDCAEAEVRSDMAGVPIGNLVGDVVPMSEDIDAPTASGLPSSYSSDSVTSVKDQGSLGSCWAFASTAAMEANAKKKGLVSPSGEDPDYSELALGYYAYGRTSNLVSGGWPEVLANNIHRWIGPVWENGLFGGFSYAYPSAGLDAASASALLTSYSDAGAFSNYQAYENEAAHLEGYSFVNSADRNSVKELIMEYGAGAIVLAWDTSCFSASIGADGRYAYNVPSGYSYSCGHVVTIVGWDDNYSASNFKSGLQPASNGAWLVKNSWGTSESSAPFFWVSYETTSYNQCNVSFFDMESSVEHGTIQQVGRGEQRAPREYQNQKSSNIFIAPDDGALEAVSIYSGRVNLDYTVQVFTNLTDGNNPTSGALSFVSAGTKEYVGYESITLDEPIALNSGESYSVVVELQDENGVHYNYAEVQSQTYNTFLDPLTAGQSFFSNNGLWADQYSASRACSIRAFYKEDVSYAEYSGSDRYETAAQAVLEAYPNGSNGIIVASGVSFPDALSASGLAGVLDYPVLTTDSSTLSSATLSAISQLKSGQSDFHVIIVGGTAAVSSSVESALKGAYGNSAVTRISGDTRYSTNVAINAYGTANGTWGDTVILCTGENFPDAMSSSPYSFASHSPIILVGSGGSLSDAALQAIGGGGFTNVLIVGGTDAIPESVKTTLGTNYNYQRISGEDRYKTALAVTEFAVSSGALSWNSCGFATGADFPDALAGGVVQGKSRGCVLLVDSSNSASNEATIAALWTKDVNSVRWFGGSAAITTVVRSYFQDAIG